MLREHYGGESLAFFRLLFLLLLLLLFFNISTYKREMRDLNK
jgi:hypothetical protein